jgi:small neutral amino acid transporter SnatA (MarC family)
MFCFGFWVLACAVSLLLFPGLMLRFAGVTVSNDVILRINGMVLLFLAVYYFVAGRRPEFRPLYQATVYTRASALPLTAALVLLLRANPLIILFTVVDALGALWTALALRADRRA